jgi:SAM-dependent methyltransferase
MNLPEFNNYDVIADLYDTYVPATYDIDFFVREVKKTGGEVLELMSGTGRVSIPLLEAGVRLTCVDLSGELNAIFKRKLAEKGLKAELHQMDICELRLPKRFTTIIIPFQSFAHLVHPQDQRKALEHIYDHLLPGGTFICTLGNPALRKKAVDGQLRLFRKYPLPGKQGSLLLWISENLDPEDSRVVHALQFYEEYDPHGVLRSKRLLELHFRLTGRDEFERLAKEAGLRIKTLYGDYDYAEYNEDSSPFIICFLEKPGEIT